MFFQVDGGQGLQHLRCISGIRAAVTYRDQIRLPNRLDRQIPGESARSSFHSNRLILAGSQKVKPVVISQAIALDNLAHNLVSSEQFHFRTQFFFADGHPSQVDRSAFLRRHRGVRASPPHQEFDVGFVLDSGEGEKQRPAKTIPAMQMKARRCRNSTIASSRAVGDSISLRIGSSSSMWVGLFVKTVQDWHTCSSRASTEIGQSLKSRSVGQTPDRQVEGERLP